MKVACWLFVAALTFSEAPALSGQSRDDTLRVLALNLHGLLADGDDLAWDPDRASWLVEAIIDLDVDLVGFQEVLQSQDGGGADNQVVSLVDSLEVRTGLTYTFDTLMTHDSWGVFREGIAVLSRHPVFDSQRVLLESIGVFQRGVVGAAVNTPLGLINFYSTHLAFRSDHESIRTEQVAQVKSVMSTNAGFSAASIVAGDFNATPGSPSIDLALSDDPISLLDTFSEADSDGPGFTYPVYGPERRIDYVFIAKGSSLTPVSSRVVLAERRGDRYFSDHLGVLVAFIKE